MDLDSYILSHIDPEGDYLLENLALLGLDVPLLRTILDVAHGRYAGEKQD